MAEGECLACNRMVIEGLRHMVEVRGQEIERLKRLLHPDFHQDDTQTLREVEELRGRHGGHLSYNECCPFCTGDIT